MQKKNIRLSFLIVLMVAALSACLDGGDPAKDRDDDDDEGEGDDAGDLFDFGDDDDDEDDDDNDGASAVVTRCAGPSCPRGECGFDESCSAYDGFDAEDPSSLCSGATGAREFCLEYEVPREDGFVDTFSSAFSCASPTAVERVCSAGCGYNYAPDDCALCSEIDGCVF